VSNVKYFKEHGYCIIKSAISKEMADFITQYSLFDEIQNYTPDTQQVVDAHARYADPAMETMLLKLKSLMEENTGLSLYPTYSFYRVYRNGDELAPHTDRPSCEISATMCFNYSYDDNKFSWPIFMDGNEVTLSPGDLVIYKGCDLAHWREKLIHSDSVWHVQGFFHYVNANGPYAEFKYDKRNSIGEVTKSDISSNASNKSYISYTN
jgi:hypothetical protein